MFFGLLLFETVVRRRAGLLEVHFALQYPVQVLDNEFGRMWYKKDLKFHMPKGKQTGSSPITISCVKHVLNWANICFTNLVWWVQQAWRRCGVRSLCLVMQTFTSWTCFGQFDKLPPSYVRCPKSFAQHALGIFAQFGEPCLRLVESKESSPVDEAERTKNRWWCQYFTRLRGNWSVCWLVGCTSLSRGPRTI